MSDEHVENSSEEEVAVTPSPDAQPESPEGQDDTVQPSTPEQPSIDPKTRAREHYQRRQEAKLKKQSEEALNVQLSELNEKVAAGDIPDEQDVLSEVIQEKDQKIREYELKEFLAENPVYAPHKDAIQAALKDPRYASLNNEDVANMVAARTVLELQAQDRKVAASSSVPGSSARSASNEVDYRNMDRKELERRATSAKFK